MLPEEFIIEIGIALQAQNRVLQELKLAVSELDTSLAASAQKRRDLAGLLHPALRLWPSPFRRTH